MNLIREAFERLLHYQYSLNDPSARAEEEQSVLELSRKASELWQEHPEWLVIWTRILGLLETGGLVCCPTVAWIFTQNEPQSIGVRNKIPEVSVLLGTY